MDPYQRYVNVNMPHARTIVFRIGRSLSALGAFREDDGGALALQTACTFNWTDSNAGFVKQRYYVVSRADECEINLSPYIVGKFAINLNAPNPISISTPFVLKKGSTLQEFAGKIHQDLAKKLKSARIWGSGAFDGQMVSRDHILQDGDIVELKL